MPNRNNEIITAKTHSTTKRSMCISCSWLRSVSETLDGLRRMRMYESRWILLNGPTVADCPGDALTAHILIKSPSPGDMFPCSDQFELPRARTQPVSHQTVFLIKWLKAIAQTF